MNKIYFIALIVLNISCTNTNRKNVNIQPSRNFVCYESENISNASRSDLEFTFERQKSSYKTFRVYSVYDNGDRVEVGLDIDSSNEEAAAKEVAAKVAVLIKFNWIGNYDLTIEEGQELTKQHPEFFYVDLEDHSMDKELIHVIYDSIPTLLKIIDREFYNFPIENRDDDLLIKYLNNIYNTLYVDLNYGVVTSAGDDFEVWTFMESGTSVGYSVKVKRNGNKPVFQYIGKKSYQEY